jgi:two-component system, NtrC family, nitrogen regulation sensor histidine kinase NtrY
MPNLFFHKKHRMSLNKHIILFISLVVISLTGNFIIDNWHYKQGDHRRLQNEINKKFKRTDRIYEKLKANDWQFNTPLPKDDGITLVVYRHDSLIYWSDNSISLKVLEKSLQSGKRFDSISNGWYIIKPFIKDSLRAYGLIQVKSEYPYENDFLANRFQPDLRLPASTELLTEAQPGSYSILDWEGIYLFSIKFRTSELRFAWLEKYLMPALALLILLSFLALINKIISGIAKIRLKNTAILALIPFFAVLRWVQYTYHIPADIYEMQLFGPALYAKSVWLPSLGDVLINTLLMVFILAQFCINFRPPNSEIETPTRKKARIVWLIFFLTGFYIYSQFILSSLIIHSTIKFEFFKVGGFNVYTMLALLITALNYIALMLLANKLLRISFEVLSLKALSWLIVLIGLAVFSISLFFEDGFDYRSYLAFLIMFIGLAILYYRKIPIDTFTTMAFLAIFFSICSIFFIARYAKVKNANNMRVMAENLATQHDPVAEYLLEHISAKLSQDDVFQKNYLFNRKPDDQIFNYLRSKYFNGFWGKYKIVFAVCYPYDDLTIEDSVPVRHVNCYSFYDDLLAHGSMKLARTDFYYLNIQNGQINYLGWFTYKKPGTKTELTFYLELSSRLVSEELGYPELLLDKKYQKNKLLEEYSYAKYYKNRLLAQSGTFQYSLDLKTYKERTAKFEGYNHLIYYLNKDNVVMVSKPTTTFFDQLVSFSYILIFYYIVILILYSIRNISKLGKDIRFNFKNKIQYSIIGVIFMSLILVGGGTIYFSIQQYQKKQHDILSEKIQSVYVELDHMLAYLRDGISPNWKGYDYDNLNQLLINFSDIFYSDINLYDPNGNLLATSRDEIFKEGILGEKMNPMAYSKMVKEKQAEFIHRETIGKLSYMSAYVPFVNSDNKLMAYLNLPYFTRQNILRNDVSTLVIAILNIYVLLILLTLAMAVIISDQITRPLRMIQQKFSEIKIGRKSEIIVYKGHDEIAGLVNEYNRMVKELVRSLDMLAKSERESAWREMAKQVAHEIKNPLTPMKLSVQHLQRSWKDKKENFDEYLERVSRTLIEQIDNLSFIASEFGNFAKMPKAINEKIELVGKIHDTLTLFANTENVDFDFEHEKDEVFVYADKEQLSRVFINLIKNAIQSIPDSRPGKISILLALNESMVQVSVTDNGKGIPEEVQNKLFTPSFTTKSSGMGLGLTIIKNIIESFGGNITFKTNVNVGTTFTFELPVYERPSAGAVQ